MELLISEKINLVSNSIHPHRKRNYELIFETIRISNKPMSIAEICRITNISYPTVVSVLDELYEKKLIQYKKNLQTPVGRKPITVAYFGAK